jgi:2,4-dienoyl-CoA reductase-like NADH-dependent reductase (Old Yellow Enzyme family)
MTEGLADANDNPTEALINLFRTWSDGGTGLLMTGNVMIDRRLIEDVCRQSTCSIRSRFSAASQM